MLNGCDDSQSLAAISQALGLPVDFVPHTILPFSIFGHLQRQVPMASEQASMMIDLPKHGVVLLISPGCLLGDAQQTQKRADANVQVCQGAPIGSLTDLLVECSLRVQTTKAIKSGEPFVVFVPSSGVIPVHAVMEPATCTTASFQVEKMFGAGALAKQSKINAKVDRKYAKRPRALVSKLPAKRRSTGARGASHQGVEQAPEEADPENIDPEESDDDTKISEAERRTTSSSSRSSLVTKFTEFLESALDNAKLTPDQLAHVLDCFHKTLDQLQ